MRIVARLTFGALAVVAAASTASADVHLTMQGGRITLVARDATVRQILAEWERVGQTKVINAERIAGGPLNLELTDVPEQKALDVLLRSVSGVLLAPRAGSIENLSAFERIIVMPTSNTPQPSSSLPSPAIGQAPFQQQPRVLDDDQDDRPAGEVPQNRGPVFAFPPRVTNPPQMPNPPPGGIIGGQPQQPASVFPQQGAPGVLPPYIPYPGAPTTPAPGGVAAPTPGGVSVPGMIVPTPPPLPGQPGFPPPQRPQNP